MTATYQENSAPRPWLLEESNLEMVRQADYQVAVLPFGATEPHNLHLPYGTDIFEAQWISEQICGEAWKRGGKVVALPAVPYGTETNLQRFPLAMNINPSTLQCVLTDLLQSLCQSGIKKVVLLNSHGGNDLKPMMRELYGKTDAQIFLCNWYQMVRDEAERIFDFPDDHAGEMETSMILAYRPELVALLADGSLQADQGSTQAFRFEAMQKGWVSITRPWHLLTTNSGSGNPHHASAEKGQQLMAVLRERLVPFLVQLSQSELDERFPFEIKDHA